MLPLWKSLHSKHEERVHAYSEQGNLVILGGSELLYLKGYNGDSNVNLRRDFAALELGIPGDTTTNLLWRLQNGEVAGLQARVVVVWVGSADIMRYIPRHLLRNGSPEEIDLVAQRVVNSTMAAMAQIKAEACTDANRRPPHVVLMGVLPRGDASGDNKFLYTEFRPITTAINSMLQEAAGRQQGAAYLDCGPRLMFNTRYVDDQLLPSGVLDDHNSPGMQAVTQCMHEYLSGLVEEGRLEVPSALAPGEWHMDDWHRCSSSCGGWRTRTAVCKDADGLVIDTNRCIYYDRPEEERAMCNSEAPCKPAAWVAGPWGECSAECDVGEMHREVWCMDSDGRAPEEACTMERPPTSKSCRLRACDFCEASTCLHGGQCVEGGCECDVGFGGQLCEVPGSCSSGLTDVDGVCCEGSAVGADGACCPAGHTTDSLGDCCTPDAIDVCGTCDGSGKALDILGSCCVGSLDAAGVCCENGEVDDCGICGGRGLTCEVKATVRFDLSPSDDQDQENVVCAAVRRRLSEQMSELLSDWRFAEEDFSVAVLSTTGLSGEDCTAPSKASADREQVAELGGRARRFLQQAWREEAPGLVVELTMAPRAGVEDEEELPSLSADAVRAVIESASLESPVRGYNTREASLREVARQGSCGNNWCEAGESGAAPAGPAAWSPSLSAAVCRQDCPTTALPCPPLFGNSGAGPCSGHGVCAAALGLCRCDIGYAGEDCSACDVGFMEQGRSCVRPPTGEGILIDPNSAPGSPSSSGQAAWVVPVAVVFSLFAAAGIVAAAVMYHRRRRADGSTECDGTTPTKTWSSVMFNMPWSLPSKGGKGAEPDPPALPPPASDYSSALPPLPPPYHGGKSPVGGVVMGTPADSSALKKLSLDCDGASGKTSGAGTPRVFHHHHYHHHESLPTTSTAEAPPVGGMITPRGRLQSLGAESAVSAAESEASSHSSRDGGIPASFAGMSMRMEQELAAEMAAADVDLSTYSDVPTAPASNPAGAPVHHKVTPSVDTDVFLTTPPMELLDDEDRTRVSPVFPTLSHDGSGRAVDVAAELLARSNAQAGSHAHVHAHHHPTLVRAGRHSRHHSVASDDLPDLMTQAAQAPVSWAVNSPVPPTPTPADNTSSQDDSRLCAVPMWPPASPIKEI